jgi:hypothetical protein
MDSESQKKNFLIFRDCLAELIQSRLESALVKPSITNRQKRTQKKALRRLKTEPNAEKTKKRVNDLYEEWLVLTADYTKPPLLESKGSRGGETALDISQAVCFNDGGDDNERNISLEDAGEFIDVRISFLLQFHMCTPAGVAFHPLTFEMYMMSNRGE